MKRFICFMLVLCMALTTCVVPAFAVVRVWSIGSASYNSLSAAVNAAEEGDGLSLNTNETITSDVIIDVDNLTIHIPEGCSINLNGYAVILNPGLTLTFHNSTFPLTATSGYHIEQFENDSGSTVCTSVADDSSASSGDDDYNSIVTLTAEASTFSVTVPSSLPVTIDAAGNVTVASNAVITNNSNGPVKVNGVSVTGANDWSKVAFSTDFSAKTVGLKEFGMKINNTDVYNGDAASTFSVIDGGDSESFTYAANVAVQSSAVSNTTIANVVFTIGWDTVAA